MCVCRTNGDLERLDKGGGDPGRDSGHSGQREQQICRGVLHGRQWLCCQRILPLKVNKTDNYTTVSQIIIHLFSVLVVLAPYRTDARRHFAFWAPFQSCSNSITVLLYILEVIFEQTFLIKTSSQIIAR